MTFTLDSRVSIKAFFKHFASIFQAFLGVFEAFFKHSKVSEASQLILVEHSNASLKLFCSYAMAMFHVAMMK